MRGICSTIGFRPHATYFDEAQTDATEDSDSGTAIEIDLI